MIWQSQEFDLTVEEAEEYAAQIGSLITISEVYGGLPSGGSAGEILIKNSDEDYDAIWGIVKNGANIWWTNHLITQGDTAIYAAKRYVIGRTDMQPEIHDFLVGRDIEVTEGTPNTLYEIIGINQLVYNLKRIGNIGENDYNKLLNKPRIDGIEINKDSTPASLGLATASALEGKYTKPNGGIPASDLAEGVIPEVHNIPFGGSTGQALVKNSDEDYDAVWSDIDSELPDVNSTDYGKVLTVSNDGVWNAQRPIFMVTITNNNNVFSADKTFSEITNAAIHNMMVVATYAGAYYQYCGIGGGTAIRQFVYIFTRDNIQTIKLFSVNINNVWTQYQYQLGTYSKPDSGIPASDLADDVHLIPAGGSEGYVLKKNSSNDYDVIWTEDNITEIEYFDFTWDGVHNPVPATGVTGEAIFDAITNGKLVFARVTVNSSSYPYIFSLHAYYSNTFLEFVSVNGSIVDVLGYEYFFGQDTWYINEYIIPDPAQDTPANLGVAAVGSSSAFARADHVHAMPSAVDVGAYAKPSDGIPASDLASDVHLIPSGGTIGQVLRKISNNDWDIDWSDFNGCVVWWTNRIFIASTETETSYTVRQIDLNGSTGTPSVNDYVFGPVAGRGEIDSLFQISSDVIGGRYNLTPITTFHGTSDYDSLTNKPSINNVELSGDKSLSDLGIESKPMLVTLSWTGSGDIYTADKTYAEITNAMAAGQEVLVDWGASILRPSEPGFTWIGYDDGQILEFILHEDSSWIGIITDLGSYRTAADQDVIDRQQNTAIAAKYTKPASGIPAADLAEDAQRGYTSEERVTLVPEGTYTFVSDGSGYTGAYEDLALEEVPEIDPLSPPAYVMITVDGVAYEKEYNESESDNHIAVYGNYYDTETVDCALLIDLDRVRAEDPAYCVTPIVQFAPDTEQEQHTFSAYFIKQPVTTTPDFDAAVAKSSAEALAGKLDADGDAYRAASIPMGHLDSTSTATVMTATIPGITELRDGVCVWLENGVIASASGVTLNINSLGAKPIYNSLSGAIVTTTFTAASTYLFVYNSTRVTGGCWDMVYGYDTNTTYSPPKLGFGYGTCTTAAATAAKTASISSYTLTAGGIVAIKFANDVPAGATLNISSKGAKAIYYKGAAITAGVIKAGDTVTMIYSTYYHVLSIDRDVDTLPPSPSDNTPYDVGTSASSGSSLAYARDDHVHKLDAATFENLLENLLAVNVPVILYDANNNGVVIQQSPQTLMNIYQHQPKLNLALLVPPDYNNYPVIFTASSLNTTTGELHLTGITGGVLYEATLLPGLDPIDNHGIAMVGTMTTTNLALPSAQGVSF